MHLFRTLAAPALVALSLAGFATAAGATEAHYTDGSTFQGATNYGPPPVAPYFAEGKECETDVIDPPRAVYVTEHFVYGTTAPAATVPVHDDASDVFPYHGVAPGLFEVNISAKVAGKQGFRADTWNIGTGVTTWVPFDCRPPETTTTTTPSTTTTLPTTTTTAPSTTSTSTTTIPATPVHHVTPPPTTPTAPLPRTGSDTWPLVVLATLLIAGGALLRIVSRKEGKRA